MFKNRKITLIDQDYTFKISLSDVKIYQSRFFIGSFLIEDFLAIVKKIQRGSLEKKFIQNDLSITFLNEKIIICQKEKFQAKLNKDTWELLLNIYHKSN